MSIAYLIAQFPKPSETFVSREVLALRGLGIELRPIAFQPPTRADTAKLDPAARGLLEGVDYLSPGKLLRGALSGWQRVWRGWHDNRVVQRLSTSKSNPHLRLARGLALAHRLRAAGVTHLHAHWPYATQVAYLVHRLTGIPFSVSIHAHEVEYDYGHFPSVFEALSFATFCNRAAMQRLFSRLPAAARDRSHLVYHGVDLERFPPLPFPPMVLPLQIVSAGRLTRTKGFHRLVCGCARFHSEGGRVELTILGQGPLEPELKRLADDLGFAAHLHLPGWLPHDQVSHHLGASHLFALLADTRYHDGLPNVVLEAMASARPVVLSPLPAAGEAVTPGCEGFVLESPDDESAFVGLLRQVAANPARLRLMGQAARQRVKTCFNQAICARQLKGLFEEASRRPALQPMIS